MALETNSVEIPVSGGGTMGGYLTRPEGDATLPGVLVLMEIFGINQHIRAVTDRIAEAGYVALAPDYFHRTGPGIQLDYDDAGMAEGMKHLGQLNADSMISDAQDAIAFLRSRPGVKGESIGAVGFCIGGHMTYLAACETDITAAAAYYGGGIAAPQGPGGGPSTLSRSDKIRGKLICYFGGKDTMIPQDQVSAVREALAKTGGDHEVIVYPEADHGFNCNLRESYHEASAEDAWSRTLALFSENL
ncbi:MAG: dienelactone hydrolase family protein [Deltaproteobacteria bacterium]|nr:dienelactone hydrolase family protein [Deltaproteobacteria bacterium]MBW2388543.1 dienelactone hydrolase family protein [Deltaproteobacteria bacterium]